MPAQGAALGSVRCDRSALKGRTKSVRRTNNQRALSGLRVLPVSTTVHSQSPHGGSRRIPISPPGGSPEIPQSAPPREPARSPIRSRREPANLAPGFNPGTTTCIQTSPRPARGNAGFQSLHNRHLGHGPVEDVLGRPPRSVSRLSGHGRGSMRHDQARENGAASSLLPVRGLL